MTKQSKAVRTTPAIAGFAGFAGFDPGYYAGEVVLINTHRCIRGFGGLEIGQKQTLQTLQTLQPHPRRSPAPTDGPPLGTVPHSSDPNPDERPN